MKVLFLFVSIQPKPKNGLEGAMNEIGGGVIGRFNPAEAEEWFRSWYYAGGVDLRQVSIQPKPKNGLEVFFLQVPMVTNFVSIQPKPKNGLEDGLWILIGSTLIVFQSSRSRRMV